MNREEKAMINFGKGYNCCQSVFLAFADDLGLDEDTAAKIAAPFGGGIGGMGKTCGSLIGAYLVAGYKKGYYPPTDKTSKYALNELIKKMTGEFEEKFINTDCSQLKMNIGAGKYEIPATRPDGFSKRPCSIFVEYATQIAEENLY